MDSASLDAALRVIRVCEDPIAVRETIMTLGYETSDKVYPILVAELNDPNPAIQHAAVISLGRYGRPEAIDELVKPKIFRSPEVNIRWAAVAAVGKLGDYRVIDHLLKAVEDQDWIVRTQAATELQEKVRDIIGRKDVKLARILVHLLSLDSREIVELAIDGFKEFGAEGLPLLYDALNNSSAMIRANAARALGRLKAREAAPYLVALLQDSAWQVRACAAEALGAIGDRRSLDPLVHRIQDNSQVVQEKASQAIVKFGKQATLPLLTALARERDKFSQRAFLKCLGQIGDPKSIPALISYLRSSYFIVRQTAVAALIPFGPVVTPLIVPTLSFNRSDIELLSKDACDKFHPELQMRAIKALGGLEDHRAVKLLKKLVEESLPDVQEAAVEALSQIGCAGWGRCCGLKVLAEVGDASLVESIAPSFQDHSETVRFEAVRAAAGMGGGVAVKLLVRTAKTDRVDFVRAEAVRMLRRIGIGQPGVLDAALRALKDQARIVRRQAARLLGNFHDLRSIMPLLGALSDPHWSIRESAENALLNFGRTAVPPLIEALNSRSWTMRFRAARLLGELGDSQAAHSLKKTMTRPGERANVREAAAAALHKLEPHAAA